MQIKIQLQGAAKNAQGGALHNVGETKQDSTRKFLMSMKIPPAQTKKMMFKSMKMKNYYCGDGNNNQDDSTNEVAAPIVDETNDENFWAL